MARRTPDSTSPARGVSRARVRGGTAAAPSAPDGPSGQDRVIACDSPAAVAALSGAAVPAHPADPAAQAEAAGLSGASAPPGRPGRPANAARIDAPRLPAEYDAGAVRAAYEAVSSREARRELARSDLFYLMTRLMGRADMENAWCYARCREVGANPDGYLDLWAREHYKSTIITVGKTIQDILVNPEITAGIFSHTRPIAKSFLRQIKREFESNEILKDLFADILYAAPKREAPQWSEDGGIIVRREGNPKEATIEAWGLVDGQPIGKHFSLLVYDDVVTRESVTTPEMIAKTTDAWALSLNLGAKGGKRRVIGTRYHFNDTYKTIMDRRAATPRVHTATENGRPDGPGVLFDDETLAAKRRDMGPYIFGCQMLQNPLADTAQGFKREWLRFYTPGRHPAATPGGGNVYLLCDPAGAKKRESDYTVIWVFVLGADGNTYIADGVRDRLNLTERAAALFRLHRKWRPAATGYEHYGMQADIEHIRYQQEAEGYRFSIVPLGGGMPKADRIRRLVPLFEQGRFYLPERLPVIDASRRSRDLVAEFVEDEYIPFPVGGHDDMLDCASRILDPAFPARFPMAAAAPGTPEKPRMCITEYDVTRLGQGQGDNRTRFGG